MVSELLAQTLEQLLRHRGKVIGTLLGLVLGWMVISYGLFKTLVVVAFLVVGYYIGALIDGDDPAAGNGWRLFGRRRRL